VSDAPDVFPPGTTTVTFTATDAAGNVAKGVTTVTVRDTTSPTIAGMPSNVTVEAAGRGTAVTWPSPTASDAVDGSVPVVCVPASGALFGVGTTTVTCTATDAAGNAGHATFAVIVVDTTPPTLSGIPADITLTATGPNGAVAIWPAPTAIDLVSGLVSVVCVPASGRTFPVGTTEVVCSATDAAGNTARGIFHVLVQPVEACLVVDFREITYFRGHHVITSSNPDVQARNGLGAFDSRLWPYDPRDREHKTRSRGTLFRIYGFAPSQRGALIPNSDDSRIKYRVTADPAIPGAYYVDLAGPARATVCPSQLQTSLLDAPERVGVLPGRPLSRAQRNVPGLLLAHNAAWIHVPERVRDELAGLGRPLLDRRGREARSAVIDYVAVQLWGHGNERFREFVDAEIRLLYDDPRDRIQHYDFGFHTAQNSNYESFAGCNYVDFAPGNDSVRMNDVWAGNHADSPNWGPACGRREPRVNQDVRANYAVAPNAVQLLPTVGEDDDTLRIYYGKIRVLNDPRHRHHRGCGH